MLNPTRNRIFISLTFAFMMLGRITGDIIAVPVLSGMEIITGTRGTILSLTADAPFQCTITRTAPQKVKVFLPGCIYGLSEFSFSKFDKQAPLTTLVAQDINDGSGIMLEITLKKISNEPFMVKSKGNQQLILLSKQADAEFSWKAEPVKSNKNLAETMVEKRVAVPVEEKKVNTQAGEKVAQATLEKATPTIEKKVDVNPGTISRTNKTLAELNNITMLQRGNVCKLEFEFNRVVAGGIRRYGDSLVVVFSDAKNAIGKGVVTIKPGMVYQKVILTDSRNKDGKLTATILLDTSVSDLSYNVTHQDNRVLSIYILHRTEQRNALWSAVSGTQWDHEFTILPYRDVDLNVLGARAQRDASVNLTSEPVFTIGDPVVKTVVSANTQTSPKVQTPSVNMSSPTSGTKPETSDEKSIVQNEVKELIPNLVFQTTDTVIFTADNLNIRALPSLNGAVIGKGTIDSEVFRIKEVPGWTNVYTNGTSGWVSSRFVKETSRTTIALASKVDSVVASDIKNVINLVESLKPDILASIANDSFAIQRVAQQVTVIENTEMNNEKSGIQDKVVRYTTRGRDPFMPLARDTTSQSGKPAVEKLSLVGLLVDGNEKVALFESKVEKNRPFTLKENDAVEHGKVLRIYRDRVVFLLTEFGISRSYTMRLYTVESDQEARVR